MTDPVPDVRDHGSVDLTTPSAAASDLARGVSQLRDALGAAAAALQGKDTAGAAAALKEAEAGAMRVSMILAVVGATDMAGKHWPGVGWWRRLRARTRGQ